jgi:nickel-type superoxide dismutase maturation protease
MTSRASLPKPKKPKLFIVRRVAGDSMAPTLTQGAIVLAWRPRRLAVGDIVVLRHKGLEKIKRITAIQDEQIFVTGDNLHASTDSRHFGWLPRSTVIAKL